MQEVDIDPEYKKRDVADKCNILTKYGADSSSCLDYTPG